MSWIPPSFNLAGDTQLIDFVEGLGPAQMVGRQVLGMFLCCISSSKFCEDLTIIGKKIKMFFYMCVCRFGQFLNMSIYITNKTYILPI